MKPWVKCKIGLPKKSTRSSVSIINSTFRRNMFKINLSSSFGNYIREI